VGGGSYRYDLRKEKKKINGTVAGLGGLGTTPGVEREGPQGGLNRLFVMERCSKPNSI